jgi:RNA polymerase sigma-70 factor (ECF subfamily)
MQADDDHPLILRAQVGDLEAFTLLVIRHQGAVRAFLLVRLPEPADAEDLAQEVFLTAHRRIASCDPDRPMLPWLRGIAQNLWRNHIRKFRPIPLGGHAELQELVDSTLLECAEAECENPRLEALRDCVGNLSENARALLHARYGEGRSVECLSKATGRAQSALTMQLHRMRLALALCVKRKLASA